MMATDITNLNDDTILEKLGDGDWVIVVAKNMPDLLVTKQWRNALLDTVAEWFVRWVKAGKNRALDHSNDPSWDSSGYLSTTNADPLMLLIRYETLEDWLDNEYTGDSIASFVSGCGLFWETYGEQLKNIAQEKIFSLLKYHMASYLNFEVDVIEDVEEFNEWDEVYDIISICLVEPVCHSLYPHKVNDIWREYEPVVQKKIEAERIEAELYHQKYLQMRADAEYFWQLHFPDLITTEKLEMPQFKELNIADQLIDILADTDPQIIASLAKIGWIGPCSNTVDNIILALMKEALD